MDGLSEPWVDRTYVNPPYKDLKAWLEKSRAAQLSLNARAQILLFPARPNRQWWFDYMRTAPARIVWLKPLTFWTYRDKLEAECESLSDARKAAALQRHLNQHTGAIVPYPSSFPAPLVLVYTGVYGAVFERAAIRLSTGVTCRLR